ncbi:hypothetical protein NQ176_g5721 [Zarea fungicola]|uniref:Uncharacterized protein n=1 Tax=Zarea fungicola TaxID=93591 RepID=A0ACC1N857_9HYPO|nr:hypothetical protein NQ176_g5721 [Lecanicillium fungicola]
MAAINRRLLTTTTPIAGITALVPWNQGDGHYGQNLASFGASGDLGTLSNAVGDAIAKQWYDEVKNYNFYGQSDPPPGVDFNGIGHYTQMVWKSTQKVGCCTVKCPAGTVLGLPSLYTVCNYSPPGNFQGQYGSNVFPSLGLKISLSS